MAAIVTRQIRLRVEEHDALSKAAEKGDATRYIRKALNDRLIAEGFLPAPEAPPLLAKMHSQDAAARTRRRTTTARKARAKAKATPRRRAGR